MWACCALLNQQGAAFFGSIWSLMLEPVLDAAHRRAVTALMHDKARLLQQAERQGSRVAELQGSLASLTQAGRQAEEREQQHAEWAAAVAAASQQLSERAAAVGDWQAAVQASASTAQRAAAGLAALQQQLREAAQRNEALAIELAEAQGKRVAAERQLHALHGSSAAAAAAAAHDAAEAARIIETERAQHTAEAARLVLQLEQVEGRLAEVRLEAASAAEQLVSSCEANAGLSRGMAEAKLRVRVCGSIFWVEVALMERAGVELGGGGREIYRGGVKPTLAALHGTYRATFVSAACPLLPHDLPWPRTPLCR